MRRSEIDLISLKATVVKVRVEGPTPKVKVGISFRDDS
jgi:hypothetical protein